LLPRLGGHAGQEFKAVLGGKQVSHRLRRLGNDIAAGRQSRLRTFGFGLDRAVDPADFLVRQGVEIFVSERLDVEPLGLRR
jgi:hypothetical protein